MDHVEILKEWMRREGRKQGWVAEQIGVSQTWLSRILNRKDEMSPRIARAIEERLGISFPEAKRSGRRRAAKG